MSHLRNKMVILEPANTNFELPEHALRVIEEMCADILRCVISVVLSNNNNTLMVYIYIYIYIYSKTQLYSL